MSDLKVDTHELDELFRDLLHVSSAFGDAEQISKQLADAVGHDDLSGRVRAFADAWDIRRAAIMTSLDTIWRAADKIGSTFETVDTELDKVLRGGATTKNGAS